MSRSRVPRSHALPFARAPLRLDFFPTVRQTPLSLFNLPAADLEQIMREAAADLEALRGKSLFLTGGTGFFGKWLLGALAHADAMRGLDLRLTVLSRDPAAFLQRHPEITGARAIQFETGDVTDFPFSGRRYDYILHAAADTTAFTSDAEEQRRSRAIVAGMERMLELARTCGARRLLNVSSGAVYGACSAKQAGAKEGEEVTARPLTPYAEAKQQAERLCENSDVDFVTARAFAFLGPYLALDGHFAAGNFFRDALKGGPILVRGDGTALRSYLHPADLVVWLLRVLLSGQDRRAYNVGSDEAVTTAQLAQLIAEASSPTCEVVIQSMQPQGPQNIYLPNIDRARTELNLKITLPLKEAICRTLEFLRSGQH
jgi:nucleoside-diphosphate-sugar epimerase